jgi:predicted RNA-binding Zn-ribbon protein involved in translation (DUF1610 family)
MENLSSEEKQKIIDKLSEKGANHPCPRCTSKNFTILDGYFAQPIQPSLTNLMFGGPSVPSVVIVCNNCGYMSQHALGMLGLLPKEEAKNHGS